MFSTSEDIRKILDLNPNGSISPSISERQLEVIRKAYQYLSRSEGNNIIYIADEVGLGKTYIALGIITLFRHFGQKQNHKDVIIVPKANLQDKWQKELSLFMQQNYLGEEGNLIHKDDEVRENISDRLRIISEGKQYNIFRMSSFSNVVHIHSEDGSQRKSELRDRLIYQVFKENKYSQDSIRRAWEKGYFANDNLYKLRRLIAYLMNVCSSIVDCLVIDEAHNYKHGTDLEHYTASIRNEVTARFLGALGDEEIFADFKDLKSKIKFPLARKVICLSATPKDSNLLEIKNQLNCFTHQHILTDCKSAQEIKKLLSSFLIRGNMEYELGNVTISRNQSREEHRKGNVNKSLEPEVLKIKDDFEGVFWQLLQYQSLKHLNLKNGVEFEMGMLAGFESYSVDIDNRWKKFLSDPKEYDLVAGRNRRESEDVNVIKEIMSSYSKEFKDELPPHPKQSKFEAEIVRQLTRQEKSLTFVRRIMTVHELESRMLQRFEKEIVIERFLNFQGKYKDYATSRVAIMIKKWHEKDIQAKLPDLFHKLISRTSIKALLSSKEIPIGQLAIDLLMFAYKDEHFKLEIDRVINRELKIIPSSLEKATLNAITDHIADFNKQDIEEGVETEIAMENEDIYYFNSYFKKGRPGFFLRTKMYRENWFDIDLTHLNNTCKIFRFNETEFIEYLGNISFKDYTKKHKLYEQSQAALATWLIKNGSVTSNQLTAARIPTLGHVENTFITRLLLENCREEFDRWLLDRIKNNNSAQALLKEIATLNAILKSIMRNGTGLLPTFVADGVEHQDFTDSMLTLLIEPDAPFYFLLLEVKTILLDYELILNMNFRNKTVKEVSTILRSLSPVVGISGMVKRDRSIVAAQFRMPGYPYVLISTDILREGEDLHTYCQNVYHYGIAWNPSDMEQRTGRIDRINSLSNRKLNQMKSLDFDNKIHVFYPYLSQSIEVNQVVKLLININTFTETFNDISLKANYDTSASTMEQISEDQIPAAIKHKIEALYDVQNFDSTDSQMECLDDE
ncbi:hypothetical protein DBR43_30510 [Pedobacter sp. KBW06]|uniref:helicase-related protein n=1 Tax=Pedobacter sp. KBW06 TaxID=2153359 RepID=UPI000F59CF13|nr:helicase-related protein [Pedobacter sp. KBW06]RQO65189.1 hypothetical protein DBR43_30510 [Pedobacter sp. KBW06]